MDSHITSSEGAGLIKADSINPGEGFNRIEVLDENFLLA